MHFEALVGWVQKQTNRKSGKCAIIPQQKLHIFAVTSRANSGRNSDLQRKISNRIIDHNGKMEANGG